MKFWKKKVYLDIWQSTCVCASATENLEHLWWSCMVARDMWNWITARFKLRADFSDFSEAINKGKGLNSLLSNLWMAAVLGGMVALWNNRNKIFHEDLPSKMSSCKSFVRKQIMVTVSLSKVTCNLQDKDMLRIWCIEMKARIAPRILPCTWSLPEENVTKVNTDGAAKGNPGQAGVGVVGRDSNGAFSFVYCRNIDSKAAVAAFNSGKIPWKLKEKWRDITTKLTILRITSTWREANFSANKAVNFGVELPVNNSFLCEGNPPWIYKWEVPDQTYYRFDYARSQKLGS
ncbi:hypothetical protein IFM89_034535 [Coptis chinensis]|uniref:Reverse transcriptase zinc-binding domain-containing protein n=1 Tax=Coptis chinensis TaxID=261450 RepID=A0A835LSG6_9MAGN|nr:hypothetical protein IFM89_034535 [Coptis chinensis]